MTREELFSITLDTIVEPFGAFRAVRDSDGRIIDFAIEYLNLAGADTHPDAGPREQQIGRRLLEVAPMWRDVGLFEAYVNVVQTGRSIRQEFTLSHDLLNHPRVWEIRAAKLDDGFIAKWRDVTDRAIAARKLRDSEANLRSLNETLEARVVERSAQSDARAQQLRELALSLADAEARERKRLAQLLHDDFQQLLSAAKLKAGIVRRISQDPKTRDGIQQLERLLEDAISASRSLTIQLSPPVLYDAGLTAAIEALARDLGHRHRLKITVQGESRAEPAQEQIRVLLFEAVRELLNNVVLHAAASSVVVTTSLTNDAQLQISVVDDGVGFDSQSLAPTRPTRQGPAPFGLLEIRERLNFIGGDLQVSSRPGTGTEVTLAVPVELRAAQVEIDAQPPMPLPNFRHVPHGPARVLVADDHAMFREGLMSLLQQEPALQVVGEAADGDEALRLARELRPDVLLLDISMPKLSGVKVAEILTREMPSLRIVGLSMHERADMAAAMRAAGAVAYFTKGGPSEALLALLRSLFAGEIVTTVDT